MSIRLVRTARGGGFVRLCLPGARETVTPCGRVYYAGAPRHTVDRWQALQGWEPVCPVCAATLPADERAELALLASSAI